MFKSLLTRSCWSLLLVALVVAMLACYTMFVPPALAEGLGPTVPAEQVPADSLPPDEPFVQPNDIGVFDLIMLYLDVML